MLEADPQSDVVAAELAELLLAKHENEDPTRWTVLQPTNMKSEGGANLTLLPDGSILASGINPDQDTYTITTRADLGRIRALRLEALTDASLPRNGPGRDGGGGFELNAFRVFSGTTPTKLAECFCHERHEPPIMRSSRIRSVEKAGAFGQRWAKRTPPFLARILFTA